MILIDSDVLIWSTRGHDGARARLAAVESWRVSTITYMELVQGCRSKSELDRLKRGFAAKDTKILPLTPAISERAAHLVEDYALSHGMMLADALIAATAIEHSLTLLTANARHFGAIPALEIEVFRP